MTEEINKTKPVLQDVGTTAIIDPTKWQHYRIKYTPRNRYMGLPRVEICHAPSEFQFLQGDDSDSLSVFLLDTANGGVPFYERWHWLVNQLVLEHGCIILSYRWVGTSMQSMKIDFLAPMKDEPVWPLNTIIWRRGGGNSG
jgi:hypothetical protein